NAEPATSTTAQTDAATSPADAGDGLPWLWIGLGLVAAALLVAWLVSRRKGEARERKPGYGFASAPGKPPAKPQAAVPAAAAAAAVPVPPRAREQEPEQEPEVAAAR